MMAARDLHVISRVVMYRRLRLLCRLRRRMVKMIRVNFLLTVGLDGE